VDEQALIDAVFAHADEDDTPLVYADWLEEQGRTDRARLIRVEREFHSSPGGEERARLQAEIEELTKRCLATMPVSAGLRKKVTFSFRRGLASVHPKADTSLTAANFRELADIAFLRSLSDFERLPAEQLSRLSLCPNVRELRSDNMFGGASLTTGQWQAVAGLASVERIGVHRGSDELGDEAAQHLSGMGQLKAIELMYTPMTDAGVARLAALSGLEVLRLPFGGDVEGSGITDAGAEAIASMRRLRELDLSGSRLTDAGLARLGGLKHLTHLDIGGSDVQSPIPVVVRLKKLRVLHLDGIRGVTDSDLKELAGKLPDLRELDLRATSITRFNLGRLLPKTKWKSLHVEAAMGMGGHEEKEVEAFREFCRERDVFVEVDWE
jgi:uncharacterized protein (TIGR02996 family)